MNWTKRQAPCAAPDTHDPNGGGHAIYLVGYATVNGVVRYFIRNSWGTNAGDSGDWEVSSAWVRNAWGLYPWTVRRAS
jgi:C1A family cysteine protease